MPESTGNQILAKLSRVTSGRAVIKEIDGLRFFAIITVVLFHLSSFLLKSSPLGFEEANLEQNFVYALIRKGGAGVAVFFTISGFILALPFAEQYLNKTRKVNLGTYYLRRLTRLEPPFIICILFLFFMQLLVLDIRFVDLLPHLIATLTYTYTFIYRTLSIINPISWSLETEVQFYLLAPLFALLFVIRTDQIRRISMVLLSIFIIFLNDYFRREILDFHLMKSIVFFAPYFLTGFLLADLFLKNKSWFQQKKWGWDIIGIISIIGTLYFNTTYPRIYILWHNVFIFLFFISAFKGTKLSYFFTRKIITVIGGMCYSIYLVHYAFLYFIVPYTAQISIGNNFFLNMLLQSLILLPPLLVICSLFFYFFEKPFMHKNWYKNSIYRKSSQTIIKDPFERPVQ